MIQPTHIYNRPAYKLLDSAFPALRNRNGALDVPNLAKTIDVSFDSIYKTIHRGRFTKKLAKKLVFAAKNDEFERKLLDFVA